MKNMVLEIGIVEVDDEGHYVFSHNSKLVPIPKELVLDSPMKIIESIESRLNGDSRR